MAFDEIQSPVSEITFMAIWPLTLLVVSKTVIIAVPALIAVTSPVPFTVAIVGLTEVQV
jgi:xanthosine utilization system XapX-like protein